MQSKLTLRLDEEFIRRAKEHSRRTGKSLSGMVADYFSTINSGENPPATAHAPVVTRLLGSLPAPVEEEDYHRYLEEKHG
jgi:hypothetical protein